MTWRQLLSFGLVALVAGFGLGLYPVDTPQNGSYMTDCGSVLSHGQQDPMCYNPQNAYEPLNYVALTLIGVGALLIVAGSADGLLRRRRRIGQIGPDERSAYAEFEL
jgi:hypothetical protein